MKREAPRGSQREAGLQDQDAVDTPVRVPATISAALIKDVQRMTMEGEQKEALDQNTELDAG